jgi:hypothetical protein
MIWPVGRSIHCGRFRLWGVRTRWTVEAGTPRIGPIRAGPSLRSRRSSQMRFSMSVGVRCGVVRGRLARSYSPASPSAHQRRTHLWAVVREMPISSATWATGPAGADPVDHEPSAVDGEPGVGMGQRDLCCGTAVTTLPGLGAAVGASALDVFSCGEWWGSGDRGGAGVMAPFTSGCGLAFFSGTSMTKSRRGGVHGRRSALRTVSWVWCVPTGAGAVRGRVSLIRMFQVGSRSLAMSSGW